MNYRYTVLAGLLAACVLSGCVSFPVGGAPFVDPASGRPHATLKGVDDPSIEAWIFTVDGRPVARDLLGEAISNGVGEIYVEAGARTLEVACNYVSANKWNLSRFQAEFEAGGVYTIRCTSDASGTRAVFRATDAAGKAVDLVPLPSARS